MVQCIASLNPITVCHKVEDGANPQTLSPGQSCVIHPGDRITLLASVKDSSAAQFELCIDGSDAVPSAAWTPAPAPGHPQQQLTAAQPASASAVDTTAVQRPPAHVRAIDVSAADEEPPRKRRRSNGHEPQAVQPPAGPAGPIMIVLVGAPGSGKSTFAASLVEQSALTWRRVNQDTIDGGKRGSRKQCVDAAQAALIAGQNVIIDRTNFDAAQRVSFLQLAEQQGAPAYCVVLHLDVSVCVKRAIERTNHEGGLQGNMAIIPVRRMYKSVAAGLPAKSEGFTSIMTCMTPKHVAAALKAWTSYSGDAAAAVQMFDAASAKGSLQAAWCAAGSARSVHGDTGAAAARGPSLALLKPPGTSGSTAASAEEDAARASRCVAVRAALGGSPSTAALRVETPSQSSTSPGFMPPGSQSQPVDSGAAGSARGGTGSSLPTAFATMMAASRNAGIGDLSPKSLRRAPARAWNDFALQLHSYALSPDRYRVEFPNMYVDEQCISIPDKYAKAQYHQLIIARDPGLDSIDALRQEHIPLLLHMQGVAQTWVKTEAKAACAPFCFGFHAVPSMKQLHMHVISKDYSSPAMKNKKHWNSFTQPGFFLPVGDVIQQIRDKGRLCIDRGAAEALLKEELRCHRCGASQRTMPALKHHICACTAAYPN